MLAKLLCTPSKVYKALQELYVVDFEMSSSNAKRLWFFLHSHATRGVLSKQDQVEIHESAAEVTKEILMEKVTISDEAMILAIIVAKLEEVICETGYDEYVSKLDATTTSTPGQEEDESDDASTIGTRKRKKKHGGGRKKRFQEGSSGSGADPEVKNYEPLYNSIHGIIKKARELDEHGWYAAIFPKINEDREKMRTLTLALATH